MQPHITVGQIGGDGHRQYMARLAKLVASLPSNQVLIVIVLDNVVSQIPPVFELEKVNYQPDPPLPKIEKLNWVERKRDRQREKANLQRIKQMQRTVQNRTKNVRI